jgi:orotidine-5'-phosphate decarboxylase
MTDAPHPESASVAGSTPIVALDVPTADAALAIARSLGEHCRFFKVGSELFTAAGPRVVETLRGEIGADVFLDLKFNDIPNTVAAAVRSAAALGVRLLTVHASGGRAMLNAAQLAADEASNGRCGILAVTVLTSFDAASVAEAWGRTDLVDVEAEVLRLAGIAAEAAVHGIVCSGMEAGAVRERFGDRLALLIPGIRLAGGDAHDQQRVMTPAAAQSAGARYLVLGRAVTAAADPAAAMARVMEELRGGSTRSI